MLQAQSRPYFIHALFDRRIHRNRRTPLALRFGGPLVGGVDTQSRRVMAVMPINHPRAQNAGPVQDALLKSVHAR